jgi:NDP-sugar pyrophosphorylase family protein
VTSTKSKLPLVVLAGGFGTRLKSEIAELPKALAPIHGEPFIALLLDKWISDGFTDFYLSLHYKSEAIIEFVLAYVEKRAECINVSFVVERSPMGTGGALLEVLSRHESLETFLLTNADTWLSSSFEDLMSHAHNAIGVFRQDGNERYGQVDVDGRQVIGFKEKVKTNRKVYINTGVYKLHRSSLRQFPPSPCSLEKDLLPNLIENDFGWSEFAGDFIDIGVPEDYHRFLDMRESKKNAGA